MRYIATPLASIIGVLLLAGAAVRAAQWRTGDGLVVVLSDRTGRVERVAVDGQALKLSDGGGLSFREFSRDPAEAGRVVLRIGAEGPEQTWTQASFADWEATGDDVRRAIGGAAEGEAYLQLGNGKDAGVGMAAAKPTPVPPGGECTISWWGNSAGEAQAATLMLERGWWDRALGQTGPIAFRSVLTGETFRAEGEALVCRMTIPARRTMVLRVAGD